MDLSAYNVLEILIQIGIISAATLTANVIRRKVAFIRNSLLPTSVIAGILIFAVSQVLQKAGREDIAVLASVAGLAVVMFMVVDLIAQLLNNVKSIFGLY